MSKCLGFLGLVLLLSSLFGCSYRAIADEDLRVSIDANVNRTANVSEDCDKWEKLAAELGIEEKQSLKNDGIAAGGKSVGWIIGKKLSDNCTFRLEMGEYLFRYRHENDSQAEKFAAENSKSIVEVLRKIWNLSRFSSDGNQHEKYALLSAKGLKEADLVPFIKEILESEGLRDDEDTGLYGVIQEKPNPIYRPIILKFLRDAEIKRDFAYQSLLLLLLNEEKSDAEVLKKLENLSKNEIFEDTSKSFLSRITAKIRIGEKLSEADWQSFDDFYLSARMTSK